MVKLEILGFKSKGEYVNCFLDTLLQTNRTYGFYVNWEKVKRNMLKCVTEISILNSLSKVGVNERKAKLKEIMKKYPEVIPIIPLIIAIREKNIVILDVGDSLFFKKIRFNKGIKDEEIDDIIDFCDKSGIINLFGEINDLYTYLLGMEVGLDSNGRKNRSGKIFENILELLLKKKIRESNKNLVLKPQDTNIKLRRRKIPDFVIYQDNEPKIVIECNFYGSTGSKPIETANAYIDLQKKLDEKNLIFIWVTDGPAWKKMQDTVRNSFNEIDFPMNYHILDKKINELFLKLL